MNKEKIRLYKKQYRQTESGKASDSKYNKSEKGRISHDKYYKTKKGKLALKRASVKWCQNHKEQISQKDIKRKYGLSYKEWLEIWDNQNGKCAICEKSFNSQSDACIDHNHETDEVRGLLCKQCNMAIGLFKDNIEIIIKATEYLFNAEEKE